MHLEPPETGSAVRREAVTTRFWSRAVYVLTLLVISTLPFDPLLNRRHVVLPVCLVCVALGLVSLYVCTLPEKPRHSGERGSS
jgi:hypothetical protein